MELIQGKQELRAKAAHEQASLEFADIFGGDLYFPPVLEWVFEPTLMILKDKVGFFGCCARGTYWTNSTSLSQHLPGSPAGI